MRRRRRIRGDRGTTVVEVLVVVTIAGILAVPLGIGLVSAGRAEQATAARLDLEQEADRLADLLRRDLRGGSIEPGELGRRSPQTLLVIRADDVFIEWTVVSDTLHRRELLASNGSVVSERSQGEVVVPSSPDALFTYRDADGRAMIVSSATDGACIALVEVRLTLDDGSTTPRPVTVVVSPRGDAPEGSC